MKKAIVVVLLACFLVGWVKMPYSEGASIGKSNIRNVVILGENNITAEMAQDYSNKYNARVFYKNSRGFLADAVTASLRGTVGPSRAMRDLIGELKNINNTDGEWHLIIPGIAERYFLVVLRNMGDGALSNAGGQVYLLDSLMNKEMENEIKRVCGNKFTIKYGLSTDSLSKVFADEEVLVLGVWMQDGAKDYPRPIKSEYFRVYQAGFYVSVKGARYWILGDIIKKMPHDTWVVVECENPLNPDKPFVEEGSIESGAKSFHCGSDYIKGLKMSKKYWVRVTLYDSKDKKEILDKLNQNIIADVDTAGEEVLVSKDLTEK